MKVVFLDFDGVLNSLAWVKGGRKRELTVPDKVLDPAAVRLVDELCRRTGAVVVISSTWRKILTGRGRRRRAAVSHRQCAALLRRRGFKGKVIDATPDLQRRTEALGNAWTSPHRGEEIQAWLADHPEVESFVILDDDSDMLHLADRLIRTDYEHGLTREHVERAVDLLQEPELLSLTHHPVRVVYAPPGRALREGRLLAAELAAVTHGLVLFDSEQIALEIISLKSATHGTRAEREDRARFLSALRAWGFPTGRRVFSKTHDHGYGYRLRCLLSIETLVRRALRKRS